MIQQTKTPWQFWVSSVNLIFGILMDEIASYTIFHTYIVYLYYFASLISREFENVLKHISHLNFIPQWVLLFSLNCKGPYILILTLYLLYLLTTFFPCLTEITGAHTKMRSNCSKLITKIWVDLITRSWTNFDLFLCAKCHTEYRMRTHRPCAPVTLRTQGDAGT